MRARLKRPRAGSSSAFARGLSGRPGDSGEAGGSRGAAGSDRAAAGAGWWLADTFAGLGLTAGSGVIGAARSPGRSGSTGRSGSAACSSSWSAACPRSALTAACMRRSTSSDSGERADRADADPAAPRARWGSAQSRPSSAMPSTPLSGTHTGRCRPHPGIAEHRIGCYSSKTTNCNGNYAEIWLRTSPAARRSSMPAVSEPDDRAARPRHTLTEPAHRPSRPAVNQSAEPMPGDRYSGPPESGYFGI